MICIATLRVSIGFVQILLPYGQAIEADIAKHRSVSRILGKLRGFSIERNRLVLFFSVTSGCAGLVS
ncbi:hypothetical protein ATO1_13805 [Phaeobacter sp. 22II1-1F12B]|nr:hypothetical protein ATO1_13805 [Phaeobacter sp. 22II1-1F12B]